MAQKTAPKKTAPAKKKKAEAPSNENRDLRRTVAAIVFGVLALLTGIGMFTKNGFVIDFVCRLLKGFVGYGFWLCPFVFVLLAIVYGFRRETPLAWRTTAALLTPFMASALVDLFMSDVALQQTEGFLAMCKSLFTGGMDMSCGGLLGGLASFVLEKAFNAVGAGIILLILLVFFGMNACGFTVKKLIGRAKENRSAAPPTEEVKKSRRRRKEPAPQPVEPDPDPVSEPVRPARKKVIDIPFDESPVFEEKTVREEEKPQPKESLLKKVKPAKKNKPVTGTENVLPLSVEEAEALAGIKSPVKLSGKGSTEAGEISDPPKKPSAADIAAETAEIVDIIENSEPKEGYEKPPIFLLKKGHSNVDNADEEVRTNRERLESTIKSFGVNASVVGTIHGPTVTRYDLALEQGVKLNRITNLAGDIALALGVVSVRIAPIPDKISTVGIEVPNKKVSIVYLRDVIDSPQFVNSKSKLSFAVGKDIGGNPVVGNIAKLPHLLIAGTTGSGKSVCMNSLIISLLYKSDPDDVKLIMIDPKMVEMGVYNGIPHLYIPVVTDPKKAAGALQWAVTEMLKRYRLFSEVSVRNLAGYNDYLAANGQPKLPNVVVVIDELADLMLVASKEVEESICRVAQMGRAAGMHLIIATQRPSADVITGLMKANIPSRIAFAVSSGLESRIILDNVGAEKLVGNGDMLYAPIGCGKPLRVQGAFVSDEERDEIVEFIKAQSEAEYSEDVMAQIEKAAAEKGSSKGAEKNDDEESSESGEFDELLPQAVDVIFDTKQASVSMLQRRLKLGYSRAARIIDQMEEKGIVGPFEGSKPRKILITKEQWMEMQMIEGTAPVETVPFEDFDEED